MKCQLYVVKNYSEKKEKEYVATILNLNGNEIMINLDRYYMLLLTKLTPAEFENTKVGYKSEPVTFEI